MDNVEHKPLDEHHACWPSRDIVKDIVGGCEDAMIEKTTSEDAKAQEGDVAITLLLGEEVVSRILWRHMQTVDQIGCATKRSRLCALSLS